MVEDKYLPEESGQFQYILERYGSNIIDSLARNLNYKKGESYFADYLINNFGAEVDGIGKSEDYIEPPFPSITGATNTTNSFKIDQNLYPGILAVGVDTLELNFGVNRYANPCMFKTLDDSKAQAASGGHKSANGVSVEWFDKEFMILARGSKGGYEYVLNNGDIAIQVMPNAKGGSPSPEIRVLFHSPFLWRMGDIQAYQEVIDYLNRWVYLEYCTVSRADLCVDKLMPLPEIDRKRQIVSRLKDKDIFYGGDYQSGIRNTGYQFGRGGIACRLYDKTYEIAVKKHGHIKPLWSENGWDGESPVSRLELQLRRDGLRRFDEIMDFAIFQDSKADIWNYGTDRFLRIVNPASASRRERAKVMDYWKAYQDCSGLFGIQQGVLPYKHVNEAWRPLVRQALGCLVSAYSRLAADVGDVNAILLLEQEWGRGIPTDVVEKGLIQKARFIHLS